MPCCGAWGGTSASKPSTPIPRLLAWCVEGVWCTSCQFLAHSQLVCAARPASVCQCLVYSLPASVWGSEKLKKQCRQRRRSLPQSWERGHLGIPSCVCCLHLHLHQNSMLQPLHSATPKVELMHRRLQRARHSCVGLD